MEVNQRKEHIISNFQQHRERVHSIIDNIQVAIPIYYIIYIYIFNKLPPTVALLGYKIKSKKITKE